MNTKVIKDVIVRIGGDPSGLDKALDDSLMKIKGWSVAGAATVAAVATATTLATAKLVALTKASLENIDVLSKQARSLGISVAAFQDMSLVAEEAGVSTESLTAKLGLMQRNLIELEKGTDAQVQAFGQLGIKIQDLQGLEPDKQFELIATRLNAITDPARKTALAMEMFGRSGRETILMLENYSGAVEEARRFNEMFGITISDVEANQVERANDAVGRLGMMFEGLGNQLAVFVAPAIETVSLGLVDLVANILGLEATLTGTALTLENYGKLLENFDSSAHAAALAGGWAEFTQIMEQSDAIGILEDLRYGYDSLLTTATQATPAMAGDFQALADEFPILSAALQDMSSEVDRLASNLSQALREGDVVKAKEYAAQLGIAVENLRKATEGADALSGLDLSGSVAWANSLSSAFDNVAATIWAAVGAAAALPGAATGGGDGKEYGGRGSSSGGPLVGSADLAALQAGGGVWRNEPPKSKGGSGRGGGGNPWEARLESLVGSLATEEEALRASYEKNLETLRGARETELLTQEEYNEKALQVQRDFRDAMAQIDRDSFQQKADAWSGALGDLASLMQSGNKKLFNIGKAAAIAQATVDGWSAAVTAWDKGMKVGGPPVAAAFAAFSVLRTGVMIANIASQQFGGGASGGMAGGGGGAPQVQDQGPTGVTNITVQGDVIGRNTGDALVKQINEAIAAGHRINLEWQGAM